LQITLRFALDWGIILKPALTDKTSLIDLATPRQHRKNSSILVGVLVASINSAVTRSD